MRTKLTWLFAVAVGLAGLATVVGAGGKPKPSGAVPVPLEVTIDPIGECDQQAGGTAICPDPGDSGSPYVNGQEGVSAQIDQYGSLIIDFGTRNVLFKSVLLGQAAGLRADSYLATRGQTRLQELEVDGSTCHQMNWVIYDGTFNGGGTEYRLLFQRSGYSGEIGTAVEQTAWALVTRTAANEWTVEPRACGGMSVDDNAVIVSLPMKGKGGYTYVGESPEALPFRLTLTAQ
jgi:hypothetical protein